MKFSESLKKNKDFKNVYNKGKSYANSLFVMYIFPNGTEQNRIGVSISKKVGNSVVRHRLKRQIIECYRMSEESFQCGYDIVVIVRKGAQGSSYSRIESALFHLGKLHKIVSARQAQADTDIDII